MLNQLIEWFNTPVEVNIPISSYVDRVVQFLSEPMTFYTGYYLLFTVTVYFIGMLVYRFVFAEPTLRYWASMLLRMVDCVEAGDKLIKKQGEEIARLKDSLPLRDKNGRFLKS